jgi:Amt family ammonium transporter
MSISGLKPTMGTSNQGGCMSLPLADLIDAVGSKNGIPDSIGINSIWVIVAGCLVMFMQAGFAFLEIGFSRAKNAGTVIAKILTNFSIAGLLYWAVGFAFAFGGPIGHVIGTTVSSMHRPDIIE